MLASPQVLALTSLIRAQASKEEHLPHGRAPAAQARCHPLYPPWFVEILAAAYRAIGRTDLAITAANEVLRLAPGSVQGRLLLASALARGGRDDDARRVAMEVRSLEPDFSLQRYAAGQPFRDAEIPARIVRDLQEAGLDG